MNIADRIQCLRKIQVRHRRTCCGMRVSFADIFHLRIPAIRRRLLSQLEIGLPLRQISFLLATYRGGSLLQRDKGLSQEELADKVGVSRQAVSKWESEQSTPDIEKIIIMSELFEVTTDYILKGIEPVSMTNKKTMYSLYLGFALIFATIAGIWSFTANRFRIDECFFIVIAGAAIGCAIALVIQVIFNLFRKE